MPTYEYKCESCGDRFEYFQSMTAERLTTCKKCGGPKVITDDIAGATFKPIDESERRNHDKKFK